MGAFSLHAASRISIGTSDLMWASLTCGFAIAKMAAAAVDLSLPPS
jgi:hypothetical protein